MDVNLLFNIFTIAILIFSIVLHEVSHGYAAEVLGDPTARLHGRLTLNPIKHVDPIGSVLLPAASYFLGGFILGWAKPVPFNPYLLKSKRWGEAIVAAAGPLSNILLALIFGLFLRFAPLSTMDPNIIVLTSTIVFINLGLAIFNLIPIPPLDGSKLLFTVLPDGMHHVRVFLERYALVVALFFIFFLWQYVLPIIFVFFRLITGLQFS